MKSHEALRKAITKKGAKALASDMKVSTSLINRWCQPNENEDDWGADNPLDRVLKIVKQPGHV